MILVIGRPALGEGDRLEGTAARVSLAAVEAGAPVELVGSVGDDPAGDSVAVALGRAGVGHAALLRDPAGATPQLGVAPAGPPPRLEVADIELGLQYLSDCRVLVVTEPLGPDTLAVVVDAARYHAAELIVIVPAEQGEATGGGEGEAGVLPSSATVLPASATVLSAPAEDGAAFAALVGRYAAALADGQPATEAWQSALAGGEWESRESDGR